MVILRGSLRSHLRMTPGACRIRGDFMALAVAVSLDYSTTLLIKHDRNLKRRRREARHGPLRAIAI
jgi:hypothetical protein